MSKYLVLSMFLLTLFLLSSCGTVSESEKRNVAVQTAGNTANTDQLKNPSTGAEKDNPTSSVNVDPSVASTTSKQTGSLNSTPLPLANFNVPELTTDDAKALLNEAYKRTQAVTVYGNEQKAFNPADEKNGYYYYADELNSKEKLTEYLNKVFTDEVSKSIIGNLVLKEINGKLAFQSSEWSSYSSYLKVNIKVKEELKGRKVLEFNYSESKTPDKVISTSLVEYSYVEDQGWRIASSDPKHIIEIF